MQSAIFKKFIAGLVLLLAIYLSFFPVRNEILYPRLGQPVILQAGNSFTIKIKTSVPYWPQQWQVSLQSVSDYIPLEILHVYRDFAFQKITLKLPEDIKDNRYSLHLSNGKTNNKRQAAVYIVSQPSDSINIIQMADLPTLSAAGNKKGDQQLKKIIQESNLINPQLVLFTGDLAYEGSWAQYYQLLSAMNSINAPLIAAPGNHEYQGWSAFLTLLGQPYHAIEYGNYLIISLNSGHSRDQLTYSQLEWLNKTLENNKQKTIIVQLHHSIQHRKGDRGYLRNNIEPLLALLKKYSVSIVLSGHWHGDALFDEKGQLRNDRWDFLGTPFVVTTAAGAKLRPENSQSPLHHGYRLVRFSERKIKNFTYDFDGDNQRDASSSIPYNKLSINYPNIYSAVLSNQLNETFESVRVEFKIPNTSQQYSVINGEISKQYINGKYKVIQVNTRLEKNSQKTIQLKAKTAP